jgi:hypothetical protein
MDEQTENELLVRFQQIPQSARVIPAEKLLQRWNDLQPEKEYAIIELNDQEQPKKDASGNVSVQWASGLQLRQATLFYVASKSLESDKELRGLLMEVYNSPSPALAVIKNGQSVLDVSKVVGMVVGDDFARKLLSSYERVRSPVTPEKDPLAHAMKEQGLWSEKDLKVFQSIDPNQRYRLFKMDENGKILRDQSGKPIEGVIDGQKLRDSHALLKAWGNRKKLSEQSQAALYKYMQVETKDNQLIGEQLSRALTIISEASKEVAGNAAAVRAVQATPSTGAVFDKNMEELARLAQVAKGISPAQAVEAGETGDLLVQFRDFQKRQEEEAKGMARPKQVASL